MRVCAWRTTSRPAKAQAKYNAPVSPTVFRSGPYRFYFFSREESRPHVHVQAADGEAKFWISSKIELAKNYRLSPKDLRRIEELIEEHADEIHRAWNHHFGQ
jgi:hypothetical protein